MFTIRFFNCILRPLNLSSGAEKTLDLRNAGLILSPRQRFLVCLTVWLRNASLMILRLLLLQLKILEVGAIPSSLVLLLSI